MPWPLIIGVAGALLIKELISSWNMNENSTRADIDSLPEKPGVFIVYDKKENIIHIGACSNLRQTLKYHAKNRKMHSFDWRKTDTAKDAYELEKNLHKEYNYKGR